MNTETTEIIEISGVIAGNNSPTVQVTVRHEKKRGCGYRKGGGTYMVQLDPQGITSDEAGLPLHLHICPTCAHGIKFCRGFTWINPQTLLGQPLLPERAGLIWVGENFYPTPAHFMQEAREQGISRRLATIPRGLVIGETRIYLAHRKVEVAGQSEKVPAIFSYFIPTGLQYVVRPTDGSEKIAALAARGIESVHVVPDNMLLDVPPSLSPSMVWMQKHGVSVKKDRSTGFYFAQVSATGQRSIDCEASEDAVFDLCTRHGIPSLHDEALAEANCDK